MSSKVQNALLALLALGVVGIYVKLGLREDEPAPAPTPEPTLPLATKALEPDLQEVALFEADSLSAGLFDSGQWRGKPAIADLNADGHADLVAAVRRWDSSTMGDGLHVWLGDGGETWTSSREGLRTDMGYGGARVADVNGDGKPDIAYSAHDVFPQVFLGDGQGGWTVWSEGLFMDGPCADIALGDVDGDGKQELVALGQFPDNGGMNVFRQVEGGWEEMDELLTNKLFGSQVHLVDLDGNGSDEIIATTSEGPLVWRFEDGAFVSQSEGLHTPDIGGSEMALLARDFDGDGNKELLIAGMIYDGHAPLIGYRWDGTSWSPWGEGLPTDEAIFDMAFGDVDGDGQDEIVTAARNGVGIIEVLPDGRFERVGRVAETTSIVHLATGDVNGDGRDEVLGVFLGKGLRVLDLASALGGTV